ncbi:MAG TPA: FHA domain-containing protein, partial [Blastocatellia bacterium]|nr:FHA domain-containing protein [Blastocatellia bacterium]
MPKHKVVIRSADQPERELELDGGATIGRAYDNSICVDDSRVSRYHAVIEEHNDGYYLDDLSSINGTAVNGEPVLSRRRLEDGDVISVGGAGTVEYFIGERKPLEQGDGARAAAASPVVIEQPGGKSSPPIGLTLAVAGITLAVIVGVVLLVTRLTGSGSEGSVRIVSPQTGTTIRGPEVIRVDARKNRDVKRIIYLLNGVEIASAQFPPYDVTLDPATVQARFGNLGNSILTITVEDEEGNRVPQPDTVVLSFSFGAAGSDPARGERAEDVGGGEPVESPPASRGIDTSALSRNLATQVSGKSLYVFDGEFAEQIRLRTGEYRIDVIDDASQQRRQISNAFGTQGVSVPLGFVLAIAQSKFRDGGPAASDQSIGFWRVPRRVAVEQGYISPSDTASTLSDPKRAAEIAAQYMKDLL